MSDDSDYPAVFATGNALVIQGDVHGNINTGGLTKEQQCHQLFKTSSYENFKDRNPPRVEGTCRWVLDHDQFRDWRTSPNNALLWISADPGCGKSVLSKSLIDHSIYGADDKTTICYFFFKDNAEQDNLATALCALLHQLFSQQQTLLRYALPLWERDGDKLRHECQEMWKLFRRCAEDHDTPPVVCVIDALDECLDDDRRRLIRMLCEVQGGLAQMPTSLLKVLVTSRPYDNVQRWFEETTMAWPNIRLRGEDENDQIHTEIDLVIDRHMREVAKEFLLPDTDYQRLRQRLLQMQHRTYLWLHLAIEEVRELCRDTLYTNEIEIDSLPKSVEDAYERILSKIKDKQRTLARQVLTIILGARRPLSLGEMAQALTAAQASERRLSRLGRIDAARLEKQIREQCGLFVFSNHSQLFLIHQTAKEFLIARSSCSQAPPGVWKASFDEINVEKTMAAWCVTYLTLTDRTAKVDDNSSRSPDQEDCHEFFEYCAEHWTSYLRDSTLREDHDLCSKVLSLYATDTELFRAWFSIQVRRMGFPGRVPEVQTQHVVSMNDLVYLWEVLSQRVHIDLAAQDSEGRTPLHWAAQRDCNAVVDWLLEHGADVNAEANDGGTALYYASRDGQTKMVRILLKKGANVNTHAILGFPLGEASEYGYVEVVQMLLNHGADVNASDRFGDTALHLALYRGHETVAQLLVEQGADVDVRDSEGNTALHIALSYDSEKMAQILVEHGADVNARDGRGDTALHIASFHESEKMAQILAEHGADVDARDSAGWTALRIAFSGDSEKMVQILVEHGAYSNSQDRTVRHSFHTATSRGYEKVVQIMVDHGVDINSENIDGYTALEVASMRGHDKVVQILVEHGACSNSQDPTVRYAFHSATWRGSEKVVQIMVDHGVDINSENDYGYTALEVASAYGHEKVVQILVDHGATRTGRELPLAWRGGHEKVVQIFLEAGPLLPH